MFDLRTMIREQRDWIVKTRRELHQIPEPAYTEKKTSARVADCLAGKGLEVQTGIAKYGVVGLMKSGRPGPGLMIRAEMDALPIAEETGIPFASVHPGAMPHLCVDALEVGTQVVNALQRIVSRQMNPLKPTVVTVGSFHAGTAFNGILPHPPHREFILGLNGGNNLGRDKKSPIPVFADAYITSHLSYTFDTHRNLGYGL